MNRRVWIVALAGLTVLAACHGKPNPRPMPTAPAVREMPTGAGLQGGEGAISAESLREFHGDYTVQLTPPRRVEKIVSHEQEPVTRGRRVRAKEFNPLAESQEQPLSEIEPEEPASRAIAQGFTALPDLEPAPTHEAPSSRSTKTNYVLPKFNVNARSSTVAPARTAAPTPPRVIPPPPPLPPIPMPQPPAQAPTVTRTETSFSGAPENAPPEAPNPGQE